MRWKRSQYLVPKGNYALDTRGSEANMAFPPRPQARPTNRGPRRATMPACRPLHGNKPTGAGQQFGQAGHRRRANAITQVFWAIAYHTRWAGWPIDRPQSRCFFWLLFFSAEKKSDEPRPAGRGTVPAPAGAKPPAAPQGRPPAPRRRKARAAQAQSRAAQAQSPRRTGAKPAPHRRKAAPRRPARALRGRGAPPRINQPRMGKLPPISCRRRSCTQLCPGRLTRSTARLG